MAAKIQIKNDSAHNFGGFYFCTNHLRKSGPTKAINNTLGNSGKPAKCGYSDIMKSLRAIYLA